MSAWARWTLEPRFGGCGCTKPQGPDRRAINRRLPGSL